MCLSASALACQHSASAPADVYRAFATAVDEGDTRTAWSLLAQRTQDLLTQRARAIASARGQPPPDDGRKLAFADVLLSHREIKSTTVTLQDDTHATVVVTDDAGGEQTIRTVREGDRWLVDLATEIERAGQK